MDYSLQRKKEEIPWTPLDDLDDGLRLGHSDHRQNLISPLDELKRRNFYNLVSRPMAISSSQENSLGETQNGLPHSSASVERVNPRVINGWIPHEAGIGRTAVWRGQLYNNGVRIAPFYAGALADGNFRVFRDENGDLQAVTLRGSAQAGIGMSRIKGEWKGDNSSISGTFNGPNARAKLGGQFVHVKNSDGTYSTAVNADAGAGAYLLDGEVEGEVAIPLTWLNNRMRALSQFFGHDKGERKEIDAVLGGKASLGVGVGAKGSAKFEAQGNRVTGFGLSGKIGAGIVPGLGVSLSIKDKGDKIYTRDMPTKIPNGDMLQEVKRDYNRSNIRY